MPKVDPALIVTRGGPDNSLPPAHGPVDPGYGVPGPVDPGYGIPMPPVVDNSLPGHGRPNYPVDPDYGVPVRPGIWPNPPILGGGHPSQPIYPVPVFPTHPIYEPPGDASQLPTIPPGAVWPPLPPALGDQPLICLVWIVGVGYRWAVLNAAVELPIYEPPARPDNSLPSPGRPSHPIAPTPAPKV
jgi:hypothetical protein